MIDLQSDQVLEQDVSALQPLHVEDYDADSEGATEDLTKPKPKERKLKRREKIRSRTGSDNLPVVPEEDQTFIVKNYF
jgi:hypothetical protein